MRATRSVQVMDPASLPPGTEVGEWRVVSWSGRGTYGTVYRVERRGREREGPYALKLALHPRDERFMREEELLSRLNHPNVPRLVGRGVWQHPLGNFPYLVMQWVAGVPMYQWAARRNPTSRQVLRLLAQVARALEATAKAGGVHRDVKGDNVLVRLGDERAFLTDFGAGVYRGAATVTMQTLPPGTLNYRSPEAWGFQGVFAYHPLEHYRGNACDDLFALGVTAYRLVTDEYPPPTDPRQDGSEVWARGGPGPRSPRVLNALVSTELEAIILRLLSQPERRFKGEHLQAAEALEHAAGTAGPKADARLFEWETEKRSAWSKEEQRQTEMLGHRLRRRERQMVERTEHQDAEAKAEASQQKEHPKKPSGAQPQLHPEHSREKAFWRLRWVLPTAAALTLVLGPRSQYESHQPIETPEGNRAEGRNAPAADGGTTGLGEAALAVGSVEPMPQQSGEVVAAGMPKGPLPGQRRPPCELRGAMEIRGGCWFIHETMKPPCKAGYYELDEGCYQPHMNPQRPPTALLP